MHAAMGLCGCLPYGIVPLMSDYVGNILECYDRATDAERANGGAWYVEAQALAVDMAGDAWVGAGVLAALSPMQGWDINVRQARRACEAGTALGHSPALHTKAMTNLADRILKGEHPLDVLKGDKTRAFAAAIATGGKSDIATIDRHAHDIAVASLDFTDNTRKIGKRLYREMAAAYSEAAAIAGISVNEMQAITWVVWRREKGIK